MGIWDSSILKDTEIKIENRLSIGEGKTPLDNYFFQGNNLYIKREDKNPTGSQKDRGLAYQISAHIEAGAKKFVISSSGNSAISAIKLLLGRDEQLTVFLSPKLSENKRVRMQRILGAYIKPPGEIEVSNIQIIYSNRAVSDAFKMANEENSVLLRGSQDQFGYQGYMTISEEIHDKLPSCSDIFIPASSGTTAFGILKGYQGLNEIVANPSFPRLHICQTSKINILVRDHTGAFNLTDSSIADSIVDRVGHRKEDISELLDITEGNGWIINDDEIIEAYELLALDKENLSYESGLASAAYLRASKSGHIMENPLILTTGVRELK